MKKNAPNYPTTPNYPPKAGVKKSAAKPPVDEREIVREEKTPHFTNRADAKGK